MIMAMLWWRVSMGSNTYHFGKQPLVWLDEGGIDGWVDLRQLGLELYRVIHRVVFKAVAARILGYLVPPHIYL